MKTGEFNTSINIQNYALNIPASPMMALILYTARLLNSYAGHYILISLYNSLHLFRYYSTYILLSCLMMIPLLRSFSPPSVAFHLLSHQLPNPAKGSNLQPSKLASISYLTALKFNFTLLSHRGLLQPFEALQW